MGYSVNPFFTIIVPTYNQEEFILSCLHSILSQSFTDYELIISDDNSNSVTCQLITTCNDSRIRYYQNSPKLGRVGNYRHTVLHLARGQWLLICDGDDFISDPTYLEEVHKIILSKPSLAFVQAGHIKGTDLHHGIEELPQTDKYITYCSGFDYLMQFQAIAHFSHLSTVSNIAYLKMLAPFRLDILSSDIETYLRLAYFGDVCLIRKPVGLWRQHNHNASGTATYPAHLENLKWIPSVFNFWHATQTLTRTQAIALKCQEKQLMKESLHYFFKRLLRQELQLTHIKTLLYDLIGGGLLWEALTLKVFYRLILHHLSNRHHVRNSRSHQAG